MKIKKVEKLVTNLHDKSEYVIHIRKLKQAVNRRLILKKAHRVIKFNQKTSIKPYIDMNTKLRQKAKNNSEKDFFKLMNNTVFGKNMEHVREHRHIKLIKLFSIRIKLSYYKVFHRKFIRNRNEKNSNINE